MLLVDDFARGLPVPVPRVIHLVTITCGSGHTSVHLEGEGPEHISHDRQLNITHTTNNLTTAQKSHLVHKNVVNDGLPGFVLMH